VFPFLTESDKGYALLNCVMVEHPKQIAFSENLVSEFWNEALAFAGHQSWVVV